MAVFTQIEPNELIDLLKSFELGQLQQATPIAQGTVNSNYDITTTQGHFVLTVFEALDSAFAERLLNYLDFVYGKGIACPRPIQAHDGRWVSDYHGKGVAVAEFITGQNVEQTNPILCEAVGRWLGLLHLASIDFPQAIDCQMGYEFREIAANKVMPFLLENERPLLTQAMLSQQRIESAKLPHGMGHYDLFRDNVLFEDTTLKGAIDFNYACDVAYIIDLSITLNDWCTDWRTGQFDMARAQSLIRGYQTERRIEKIEWQYLHDSLVMMAAHFMLSRQLTLLASKKGFGTYEKDPEPFKRLLKYHLDHKAELLKIA